MVSQKKNKASKFLTVPTRPVPIDRDRSVAGLLEKMEGAGFGARQMAEAHRIWLDMMDDNSTIYMCGSGNLITSGMRRLLAYVIKNRFVDVLVMSGTVLYHDIHETLGRNHFQAHPSMNDEDLDGVDVHRIGDVMANREEYQEADEWIGSVVNQLELSRSYSMPRISPAARTRTVRDRSRGRHPDVGLQGSHPGFLPGPARLRDSDRHCPCEIR